MNNTIFFWFIISLLFFLIELGHPGLFFFLSFALGALFASATSFLGYSLVVQSAIFIISSIFSLFFLKSWVRVYAKYGKHQVTNVDALRGKCGVVIKEISPEQVGQVKINGQIWSAKADGAKTIGVHARVEVLRIAGCHVMVKECGDLV